ncbi:MAG: 50S ribosomal protein L6 [Xanthomonadales bacterium]|nr:50S ribosomal protein L6 [Xanthomonadales bacterium]
MSRIAKAPICIPAGVDVSINGQNVKVKGPKGTMELNLHPSVALVMEDNSLQIQLPSKQHVAMAGTMRALLNNLVIGVTDGFEKKLKLVGVGYRATAQGNNLNLTLGFSHPVNYAIPEGIKAETPSQTEIIITGTDKQKVGQVASEIRAFRPPEPYKGKGVRYADEYVARKEAKKA